MVLALGDDLVEGEVGVCPASRNCDVLARWEWCGRGGEVGVERLGEGERFVGADRVVDVEVAVDVVGEVVAVWDVVAVEVLVGDRVEEPLDLAVGLGAF